MTNLKDLGDSIAETFKKITKVQVTDNPTAIDGKKYQHLVCMRVEDMPIPATEARIENCPKCNSRIWVSPNSPSVIERICYHCMLPLIANEQEIAIGISTRTAKIWNL